MTLHIWGRMSSINVRKVVWTLQELQVPFTRTDAGLAFGVTKTPEYLAKNPNAFVPLMEDGDFVLWESNAIVRYLLAKHSEGVLYPMHLQQRFDQERWMDWQQTTFNPAGREAFIQLCRTAPEQRSVEAVRKSVTATELALRTLEAQLGQHAHVCGDTFSMADIPMGCEMHRWWGLPEAGFAQVGVARTPLANLPNMQRWWNTLQARAATRGVLDQPLS